MILRESKKKCKDRENEGFYRWVPRVCVKRGKRVKSLKLFFLAQLFDPRIHA